MSKLIREFFDKHQGKNIRLFFANGYQIRGKMLEIDGNYLKLETNDYGNTTKEILITISAITTFIPG